MTTGKILIHTKLFSEDAYQIISACKKARYYTLQIFSLDRNAIFFVGRTRNSNNGLNYQVLRAPNGEVLVYHASSQWNNTDSLHTIKGELRDFIKGLTGVVREDERFIVLPTPIRETTDVTSNYVKRRICESCYAAGKFMMQARTFIYEKNDVDYIYSHPFTLNKIKNALNKIGCKVIDNEDGELDPFIIEQHKMILDAFIRLHEHISRTTTTRADKMNALRDISTLYSITVDEYGTAVLHNFMSTLPIALKVNLKEDVFKFVDNFKGRCVSFTNSQSFVSQKEMIKEELDRDLFSTEVYKDFLSALEIASDVSFYKFPSPALICSHWKDYKEVL